MTSLLNWRARNDTGENNVRVTDKPILLVEDDRVDAIAVIRALKEVHVENEIVLFENGEEALNYLNDPTTQKPLHNFARLEHAHYERD